MPMHSTAEILWSDLFFVNPPRLTTTNNQVSSRGHLHLRLNKQIKMHKNVQVKVILLS